MFLTGLVDLAEFEIEKLLLLVSSAGFQGQSSETIFSSV
jgi:hypothetical protein